jgi:SNF2 family DNA or RNA helicase
MKVYKQKDRMVISFPYSLPMVSFVKMLPGRQYHAGAKAWSVPLNRGEKMLNVLRQKGFTIDPELEAAVLEDTLKAQRVATLAAQDDTEFISDLPLFPYQKVGAQFLYEVGSGLLGDDMGLGKTIQTLAVAQSANAQKVLIFTPSSVKWQWRDEIQKFITSDRRTVVIHGSPKKRAQLWLDDSQRFYVANYEQLIRDFDYMNCREWDLIIADEATKISNHSAKQSQLIKKLRAKRRIAATGTPISNRPNEVWNIIDFTNPGAFGNYSDFMDQYCVKDGWSISYKNTEDLRDRLKRYMIRRLKKDVLTELPEKIVTDIPFPLSEEERTVYMKIKKEILREIEQKDISKLNNPMTIQYTLVKMIRLRQIADSLELIGENVASSKMAVLKEKLPEVMVDGTKAIIFTQFSEMADILVRELAEYKPLLISGKVAGTYSETVKKFNEENEHQVLVMTSAGQFGLNIQRANVVFHYDQEWSLAKMEQRDGRVHRHGQTRGVQVYNLLARGTIDYYIKKVLHDKGVLSKQVLGDEKIDMFAIRDMLRNEEEI